jgi:hypothetical protein
MQALCQILYEVLLRRMIATNLWRYDIRAVEMTIAMILISHVEYNLVNASGKPTKTVLKPDRNDIHQV